MAIAGTPTAFMVQQGNSQVFISAAMSTGATSYIIQRSLDNITFTTLASPTTPQYLDTTVTTGVQYYYNMAAVNASGTSPYTSTQSVVPTISGEMSLGQVRLLSQQRADRVNSNFVSTSEWNSYINQSLFELYDLLVTQYEDYFVASPITITSNGSSYIYPLPNGVNYNGAPPIYKLMGVDLALNTSANGYVTVNKFNFIDRNKFVYPNTASTIYGVFNLAYRMLGANIEFIPTPSGNQQIRLWYIPRLTMLLQDTDTTTSGVSGWMEYVITDAAIKALQKEESDVSVLAAQKMALIERIEASAMNRDQGQPDTISNVRSTFDGGAWGQGGMKGGF